MRHPPALLVLLIGCKQASVKLNDTENSTAAAGSMAVMPRDIDFGILFVGQTADAELTVRNVGSDATAVTLQVVGAWATDYTLSDYTSAPAPGDVASHLLHVAPTEWGDHSVSVLVDDAISGGHVEVVVTTEVQLDADGDGYASTLSGGDDCDDTDASVHPDAPDVWYDGVDSDCAGNDDHDQDGDGVPIPDDCDDENPAVYPDAEDVWYDGVDSDCAGNDDYDQDGDGVPIPDDCDDENPAVYPDAEDSWYDGVDSDCAGNDDYDRDGDGYPLERDCNDEDPSIHPGAEDTWYDGLDADCAGDNDDDQDGDGVEVDTDCDDTDASITGPTDEVLDGVDNNCDGSVDNAEASGVAAGIVYGAGSSAGLGYEGRQSLDADIDGDGVVDLVATSTASTYGEVWVVPGTALWGVAAAIDTVDTITGTGSLGYEPAYVATPALDITGDGAAELVVNFSSGRSYNYGITYVWDGGSTSGTLNTDDALYSFDGDSTDDVLLHTAMGDVDGDGVADVVVGAWRDDDDTSPDTGGLAIFDGSKLAGAMDLGDGTQIHGTSAYGYLGLRLALADVTADGLVDILASAPGDDDGGTEAGAVYVFAGTSGSFGATADDAAYAKITGASGQAIGKDALPAPGDVDGDGRCDITFAAVVQGTVWVVLGSALTSGSTPATAATYRLTGTTYDFGSALMTNSDLDGDGADEIVVGSAYADVNGSNSGVAYVFRWDGGWASTLDRSDAVASIYGSLTNDYLGNGLTGGADLNGDGLEDIMIGAPGVDTGGTAAGAMYVIPGW